MRPLLAVLVLSVYWLSSASAAAVPIRVRGGATLRARVQAEGNTLVVRGQLQDDVGASMSGSPLVFSASPQLDTPRPCSPSRRGQPVSPLLTGPDGTFCLTFRAPPRRGRVRLDFTGDAYHGSSQIRLDYDREGPHRLGTQLLFDPTPRSLDIDQTTVTITGRLQLVDPTAYATRADRLITLYGPDGIAINEAKTAGDGRVRFAVPRSRLLPPGRGGLRMSFAGSPVMQQSETQITVSRHARAIISLHAAPRAITPNVSVPLEVWLNAASVPLQSGVIELRQLTGATIARAPVKAGRAQLQFRLTGESKTSLSFDIVYLPNAPWIHAGSPFRWTVSLRRPHWSRHLLLLAALIAAVVLVTLTWRRSRRQAAPQPRVEPGIFVVTEQAEHDQRAGWSGQIRDAHDGAPPTEASIQLWRPALSTDDAILLQLAIGPDGFFDFTLDMPVPEGCTIEVRSPAHTTERRRLPPPGVLRIHLSTRRRTILSRFAAWARRRRRGSSAGEPTPQDVANHHADRPEVASWAHAVDRAAFGPTASDADHASTLQTTEPQTVGPAQSRATVNNSQDPASDTTSLPSSAIDFDGSGSRH